MPLIPALEAVTGGRICEFEASLGYRNRARIALRRMS